MKIGRCGRGENPHATDGKERSYNAVTLRLLLLVSQPRQLPSCIVTRHYASHVNMLLSACEVTRAVETS